MEVSKNFGLRDHQLPHFNRLINFILNGKGYIDTSTMGCGKTYVTCMLAKCMSLSLLVICPKTVKAVWRKVGAQADVTLIDLITFQSLSSRLEKQPRHGFLHKYTVVKNKKEHRYFKPTEKYTKLLDTGILLVVDEVQFTRNNTAQYRAAQTLVKTIAISKNKSYFAILSATPFDKPQQAINLMKMVGIIQQEELFRRKRPTGWRELVMYCQSKKSYITTNILTQNGHTEQCAFLLYSEVVRKELCSAMPLLIDAECDAKNGYYNIQKKEEYLKALLILKHAVCNVKNPIQPRLKGDCNYGELTVAMVALEKLKIPIFSRIGKLYLESDSTCRVVIGVHYLDTMFTLENNLRKYNPVLLHGKMDEPEREESIDRFQGGKCRLLICIARVGGVGISLHDTVGDSPRVMLLSPTFNLIDTHQATGRVYREGTKSKTIIRMIYANVGDQERGILRVLIKKSRTLRAILEEYTRQDVILPIDYQEEYES